MEPCNLIYNSLEGETFNFEDADVQAPRPSVLLESRKEKYRNHYQSKWANLKFFLQDKASLEASVELLKTKTVEQFSTKCRDIYRKKIEIQLLTEKNRRLVLQGVDFATSPSQFEVSDGVSGLPTDSIPAFLFMFRENNHLMLKLIDLIDSRRTLILVPFLCHFFYENLYSESMEQEEIIYLVYLLLEKEIDKLIIPCEQTFLDDSFLAQFMKEMGSRYEIKNYIDIILNDLICFLEETHSTFYNLDLNDDYLEKPSISEKNPSATLKGPLKMDYNLTFKESKNTLKKSFLKRSTAKFGGKSNNIGLIDFLPKESKFDSSEKYLTQLYYQEKNEIIKQFYFKHLQIIKTEKNPYLFDCSQIAEYLKKKTEKISQESAKLYNKGYDIVTNFITNLLSELENETIVPFTIKVICKFIYDLVKKKFRSILKLELNNFVCRFLFDKLIFPVLINPERCEIGKDRLISLVTRKNLFNIYLILKNLVRGELFNAEEQPNLVIFNKFILDNYYRINTIINKMIDVKTPIKLQNLCNQFYKTKDFVLDNSKRTDEEINYEYFIENPSDFMQHKSICFTINELNMFYDIVDENQSTFLTPGSDFEKTFETLSNFITMIKGKPNHYFVIISDDYNEDAKELLFHKENTKPLGKGKTDEEIVQNLRYCISYLISNLEILPHWEWVNEKNYTTSETFEYINQYLNSYEGVYNVYPGSVPLNWYSLYIINNLNYINPEDAENDYKGLYDEIESQILAQHQKLKKLNEFLTVNMTTKFLLIDNKIKIFQEELRNVRNTFINVKTSQLMDAKDLGMYLINIDDLRRYGIPLDNIDNITGYNNLIIQKDNAIIDKNTNKKKNEIPNDFFCYNINHFIIQLMRYYKSIYEDIKNVSLYNTTKKSSNQVNLSENPETKTKSVLDTYLDYIYQYLANSEILKDKTNSSGDENKINFGPSETINTIEEEIIVPEEIAKHSLTNYILKTLCIKMLSTESFFKEDIEFNKKCYELKDITFDDLKIPKDLYDEVIFEKIISHIKKMDDVRTPEEMLKEFELAVQLINSLFIFMLNKNETGSDNLTPVIIYVIIKARPKKMFFNMKFINYFFDEKDKKGKNEYYIIQAITSLDYIMKELKINKSSIDKKKSSKKNPDKDNETAAPTPQ